jgi:hypothetical protein
MSDSHPDQTTNPADAADDGQLSGEPLRYPTDHVVGVLDTEQQVAEAVAALTAGGFMEAEVQVASGAAAADRLNAGTGRVGLGNLAVRVAERLGIANDEMRLKDRHEEALRDGRFVILVATPTDDRKDRAAQLLFERGAHTLAYMGRFTIEGFVPPSSR